MFWLRLVYIFLAMAICLVGAGITLARRMIHEPKLTMVSAVGIGGIALYLAAACIYVTGISWNFSYAVTAACAIALACEWKELIRWWRDRETRQLLLGWTFMEMWILLINLNLRHFALWIGDWEEHFNRAKFFLERWPVWSNIFGGYYILPSRPPMMNIIESLFMAQSGPRFENYQVISGFLNAALYLAIAGLAMHWSGKWRVAGIVAALLALNPWFIQNATFTWTKLYSEFYVILGVWLYLRRSRGLGMVMMTAGCLVHYAAVIVPAFIAIYDLLFCFRQWRRILMSWGVSVLLMATWVGWGLKTYGYSFFNNTTTVTQAEGRTRLAFTNIFVWNAWHSLIPTGFDPSMISTLLHSGLHWEVKIRDWLFLAYEPGLILSWGTGGLIALLWCVAHREKTSGPLPWYSGGGLGWGSISRKLPPRLPSPVRRCPPQAGVPAEDEKPPGKRVFPESLSNNYFHRAKFWIGLVIFTFFTGLLLHTPPGYFYGGVAHVVLQPITWLGMAWIVSRLPEMPRWLVRIWCWGVLFDASWLMLHLALESRWPAFIKHANGYSPADLGAGSFRTLGNALTQILRDLWFLGMRTIQYDVLFLAAMIGVAFLWWMFLRENLIQLRRTTKDIPAAES